MHFTIKITLIQTSLKNEGYVYKNSSEKRKQITPKFQITGLVGTADLKKTFSKSDTTNWPFILCKTFAIIIGTIPT